MQGMPSLSQIVATGLLVSGAAPTIIRLTPSFTISSLATSPARLGFDWLSRVTISTLTPRFRAISATSPRMKSSAPVKPASGPVSGRT